MSTTPTRRQPHTMGQYLQIFEEILAPVPALSLQKAKPATTLTLGTAQIVRTGRGHIVLSYMTQGSFLVSERVFGDSAMGWAAARRFCRERDLRVLSA